MSYDKLTAIAELIRKYLPSVKSIGSFARITDVTSKTDEELAKLWAFGYDGLTIGIETGDDEALRIRLIFIIVVSVLLMLHLLKNMKICFKNA